MPHCELNRMGVSQVDVVDSKTVGKKTLPCALDKPTQNLIELIFSNDMFKEAMECMNLGGCVRPFTQTGSQAAGAAFQSCSEVVTGSIVAALMVNAALAYRSSLKIFAWRNL